MNYLVVYSCYETAEYYTKKHAKHISNEKIWRLAKKKSINSSDVLPNFSLEIDEEEDIHKLRLAKQKVQILWRPSFDEQIGWHFNKNEVNWEKVDGLV